MDRPRKLGAKYTGKDIQPDEYLENMKLGFEAKRDRWNGYNPQEQLQAVHDWEMVEEERKKLREAKSTEHDAQLKGIHYNLFIDTILL